jgi:hypothetical protein
MTKEMGEGEGGRGGEGFGANKGGNLIFILQDFQVEFICMACREVTLW